MSDATTLPAGPELDAEISRVVFTVPAAAFPKGAYLGRSGAGARCPAYSSSIADAWTVVERLREIGLGIVIGDEDNEWEVEIVTTDALYAQGYRGCYSQGPIAEAICRGALVALRAGAETEAGDAS